LDHIEGKQRSKVSDVRKACSYPENNAQDPSCPPLMDELIDRRNKKYEQAQEKENVGNIANRVVPENPRQTKNQTCEKPKENWSPPFIEKEPDEVDHGCLFHFCQ
jgi:hypothetical protein